MKTKTIVEQLKSIHKLNEMHTSPPKTRGKYKGHGETNPVAWLIELVEKMNKERPGRKDYDENIWMAHQLGTHLLLWAYYVRYAKSQDPNRPLNIRKKAQNSWAEDLNNLESVLCALPGVKQVFKQKWEDPFNDDATDGKFV